MEALTAIAWGLFLPACFALNMAPGPNNLMAFTNAARFGPAKAMSAAFGRLIAFAIMIAVVAIGLGAILYTSELAFIAVKWCGAAYLIYIGLKYLRRPKASAAQITTEPDRTELFRREFFVAIGNPKAIAVFTAFFPQFMNVSASPMIQLMGLGIVFLVLEVAAIAIFVLGGCIARGMLQKSRTLDLLNKGVGAMLIASGLSLAFSARANP